MTVLRATDAQARLIATIWGRDKPVIHIPGANPSWDALVRKGFLEPTGTKHIAPSDQDCDLCKISDRGVIALANYLAWLAETIEQSVAA